MKQPTIFLDVDGLLLEHHGQGAARQWYGEQIVVEGARELLDALEAEGWCVVLTTARKECMRDETVETLAYFHFIYDQLIMGIGSGPRVIVNDSKPSSGPTCHAITTLRNTDIEVAKWMSMLTEMIK